MEEFKQKAKDTWANMSKKQKLFAITLAVFIIGATLQQIF